MIAVRVKLVGLDQRGEQRVVVLEEVDGDRYLSLSIGASEAQAISSQLEGVAPGNHPLPHELLLAVIHGFGGQVKQVVIDDAYQHLLTATVEIEGCADGKPLPCRPIDGIALAMRASAPIYVTPHVAAQAMRRLPRHPKPPDFPPSAG